MAATLDAIVRSQGEVPLGWAGSTTLMDYLNFEDALSPIMTALVGGVPVRRVPARSKSVRMAAIGAIGHTFEGGEVHVWGTGCSPWKNPSAPPDRRIAFEAPAHGAMRLHATSGPVAEKLMANGGPRPGLYGDPAWLLPKFYRPSIAKKWKLGVVLHVSELADRSFEARPLPAFLRYQIPDELKDDIRLITTVTPLGVESIRAKLDEMLACERIVSMSMHGLVVAEAYGIPNLYFSPLSEPRGLGRMDLDPNGPSDLRIVDLYLGLGRRHTAAYFQDRGLPTNWHSVMEAVDRTWEPSGFVADRLIDAFPFTPSPLKAPAGKSIWEHPVIKGITLRHDVALLQQQDREAESAQAARPAHVEPVESAPAEPAPAPTRAQLARARKAARASGASRAEVADVRADAAVEMKRTDVPLKDAPHTDAPPKGVPATPAAASPAAMPPELAALLRMNADRISIPLSWAATTRESPHANLGDTLSALIVAGMAGIPVRRAGFDQPIERMVAVGTIGHNQRNGVLHFWGTGVDAERNPVDPLVHGYVRPVDTQFNIHALRGPNSARTLRAAGIEVPDIFGDPVWMLPRFWPMKDVEKTHDLGVILHITELEDRTLDAKVKASLRRYAVPDAFKDRIRLINTHCPPTPEGMKAKVAEIVSCRAIVSTSLHGLVIAETYGIPCAWFATYGDGEGRMLDLGNHEHQIDHRMRDFYSGAGRTTLSSYCLERSKPTDWNAVLAWVYGKWRPLTYDDRPLIRAFPMPLAVSPEDTSWPLPAAIVDRIDY
ncbi:polysaccharide pyruvyl transferase family protein [Ancylobacter radicis]|uniref:Polysaccharide pyruvyl transferase family protein n=1 Tax=Ancylobacter radicis TaxID=2836179 RepID=A0ABS5RB93_9HYPH|nr:polysaccharide pyruvyl transferase family protein [Ancylobacter radicis]MBS9478930.1 polysaccharide pyruvyl transferase family protein [Ancylobacter radicis]